jgi:hypothetical protein
MLSPVQMAAFTLPVKGVFQVGAPGLRAKTMAGLALLDRLPSLPDIAPALVLMMAAAAIHAPRLMPGMAESHRRLLPGAGHGNQQPAGRRRLHPAPGLGPQDPEYSQE